MFSSLLLDDPLLDAIAALGFEETTEVQEIAIPMALEGKDLIVNARTGSGKTVAYLLPLLQQILDNPQFLPQAVIIAPTRELCRQINKHCNQLSEFTDISTTVIIGGEDPKYQIKALQQNPDIIIATPGRLLEHVKREVIDLDAVNILVLDEADRMLTLGFSDDVVSIASQCNEECQTVMYSASFNQKKFEELIDQVLHEPELILIDSPRESSVSIHQQKLLVDDVHHKLNCCHYLLKNKAQQDTPAENEKTDQQTDQDADQDAEQEISLVTTLETRLETTQSKTIIFANKKDTVNRIHNWLQSEGIVSAVLHSDISQDLRNSQLRKFRNNELNVIIATDVASRGLDIPDLDLIINFDVPKDGEDYMHRIGRTGRMHNTGESITLVNSQQWNKMISIENFLKIESTEITIDSIPAKFTGPENRKSSGKAFGNKKKKAKKKTTTKKKVKNRLRDKKNIGKRRKPSEKRDNE